MMARYSQCGDLTENSNNYVTSTPYVLCSGTDSDKRKCGTAVDDSGYSTGLNSRISKSSFVKQSNSLPPPSFDVTEETISSSYDCDHSQLSTGCVSQSLLDLTNYSEFSDVTATYSTPDIADWFDAAAGVHDSYEDVSFTCRPSHGYLHDIQPITAQQPRDFISDLLCEHYCAPHVVALILRHVSDSDLCR